MSFPLLHEALGYLDGFEKIGQHECGEDMVRLPQARELLRHRQSPWSKTLLLGNHWLRETVLEKLLDGAREVKAVMGRHWRIGVLDTYRPPPVQRFNFAVVSTYNRFKMPELETDREVAAYTNMFTAIPQYGGHPCGAAVDLTLVDTRTGEWLEFGLGQVSTIFHPARETGPIALKAELKEQYETLCALMKAQGFLMTPCEWWHFMYGDTEWAVFTGEAHTFYRAVPWGPVFAVGERRRVGVG